MKKKIKFKMSISNEENIAYESNAIILNNKIVFKDNEGFSIHILIKKNIVEIIRNKIKYTYNKNELTEQNILIENSVLKLRTKTDEIIFNEKLFRLEYKNYYNNEILNDHILEILFLN